MLDFFSPFYLSPLLVLPVSSSSLLSVAVVVVVLKVRGVAEQERLAVVVAPVEDPEPVFFFFVR